MNIGYDLIMKYQKYGKYFSPIKTSSIYGRYIRTINPKFKKMVSYYIYNNLAFYTNLFNFSLFFTSSFVSYQEDHFFLKIPFISYNIYWIFYFFFLVISFSELFHNLYLALPSQFQYTYWPVNSILFMILYLVFQLFLIYISWYLLPASTILKYWKLFILFFLKSHTVLIIIAFLYILSVCT